MGCFSSKPAQADPPPAARQVTSPRPPVPVIPQEVRAPEPSAPRSRANSGRRPPQVKEVHMRENPRVRSKSTPDKPQARRGGEDLPPVPILSERPRAKSSGAPSNRRPSTPTTAGEHYHGWSAYLTDNHKSTHCQRQPPGDRPRVIPPAIGRSIRHCSKCSPNTSSVFSSTLVHTS
jgi:hypothetical protein